MKAWSFLEKKDRKFLVFFGFCLLFVGIFFVTARLHDSSASNLVLEVEDPCVGRDCAGILKFNEADPKLDAGSACYDRDEGILTVSIALADQSTPAATLPYKTTTPVDRPLSNISRIELKKRGPKTGEWVTFWTLYVFPCPYQRRH